jgi:hypothetical protein
MLPLRKPKRRPSDAACRACGQPLGWEPCEACQGYGSWDPGLGAFDCVLCGGVGWQQELHVCPTAGQNPEAANESIAGPAAEYFGAENRDAASAQGGRLRKAFLLAIVLVVLFLVLASAAAGLLAGLR